VNRILVIRLGALGDFVLSFGPFAAIRAHHATAEIALLTTAPFTEVAARAPWFDRVLVDARPAWWDFGGLARLARGLQTSARSSRYFRLAGRPRWSGIAPGCALPHANPRRDFMHTLERQEEQLRMAGIDRFPPPDLDWLAGDAFDLPRPCGLLVPGAATHRPEKRWPAARFAELAEYLRARGIAPVVLPPRSRPRSTSRVGRRSPTSPRSRAAPPSRSATTPGPCTCSPRSAVPASSCSPPRPTRR
jgi:ADP-heptose:LPS heptosyltransferase